ncbi:MAG TPA: hypothetical protein VKB47_04670 [Terracidiphilus sp.]|nr:hypothetical protein [Terracidiphilus sp.]
MASRRKTAQRLRAARQLIGQKLERDESLEASIPSLIDEPHAARADLLKQVHKVPTLCLAQSTSSWTRLWNGFALTAPNIQQS